jgi:hypothetical protein
MKMFHVKHFALPPAEFGAKPGLNRDFYKSAAPSLYEIVSKEKARREAISSPIPSTSDQERWLTLEKLIRV